MKHCHHSYPTRMFSSAIHNSTTHRARCHASCGQVHLILTMYSCSRDMDLDRLFWFDKLQTKMLSIFTHTHFTFIAPYQDSLCWECHGTCTKTRIINIQTQYRNFKALASYCRTKVSCSPSTFRNLGLLSSVFQVCVRPETKLNYLEGKQCLF